MPRPQARWLKGVDRELQNLAYAGGYTLGGPGRALQGAVLVDRIERLHGSRLALSAAKVLAFDGPCPPNTLERR